MDMAAFNQQIIDEFRANDGKVGGDFEGASMLLLHHKGAKTGMERVTPLMYRTEGAKTVVFASKAGAPDNPDWYHNLLASPETSIEIGTETRDVRAREIAGEERDRIWDAQKRDVPQFAGYEEGISRVIPVVELEPR